MKTVTKTILLLLSLSVLLAACVREPVPEVGGTPDGWDISFCAATSPEVVVSTKGTMTDSASENVVYNLYVMVFDNGGSRVYGQFFDRDKLVTGAWTADNQWKYLDAAKSSGTIHLTSAKSSEENSAECTIVVIANLNAEMVNITPQQLDHVGSWDAMETVTAELLQMIESRSGYFPMCGTIEHADLRGESIKFYNDANHSAVVSNPTLNLERLDAKIHFNVRVDNVNGNISEFVPVSWQVFNLPRYCFVLPGDTDAAGTFFNGEELGFETETLTADTYSYNNNKKICIHGFSFYMMENRKTPKQTPSSYADRDKRAEDGSFAFANDKATYVMLKGRLNFKTGTNSPVTHAEVKYLIHLGDFGDGTNADKLKDFNILRNHSYTYNVFIRGVDDIKTYVTTTGESAEPGASGDIVVPLRKLYTCDSHYSTIAIDFYYSDLKDQTEYCWWVQTPFSGGVERIFKPIDKKLYARNGEGLSEVNIASDAVDYNWVEFRVNEKNSSGSYDANTWVTYKPLTGENADGKTYTLPGLMNYLAGEVAKYESEDPAVKASSAFDNQTNPDNAKIAITGFVNEYYYEKDPTNPGAGYNPTLWRQFVNQPVRTMCILSGGQVRGESSYVRASFIIQQYSIQSVYNVGSDEINIGWGAEYMTDARELLCNRGKTNQGAYSPTNSGSDKRGNTNPDNGRWDTMIEWGLRTSAADSPFDGNKEWMTYVNLTNGDETKPYMNYKNNPDPNYKSLDYTYLRYACMSRNRDNDGDGLIDKDEVRWYMAASNQLINLYLGSYGIEAPAGLYQRTAEERAVDVESSWRHHVLGSDAATIGGAKSYSDQDSRTVWAEEGPTGSYMSRVPSQSNARLTVRCIRNFGIDTENGLDEYGYDVTYSPETVAPDALIVVKQIYKDPETGVEREYTENNWAKNAAAWNQYKNVYLDFDCSRINKKSLRYYTDRELAPHDEFNEAACLYEHFQTATISESKYWSTKYSVDQINDTIDVKGYNTWCPDGYRLPNVRELGVICYFFENSEIFVKSSPNVYSITSDNRTLGRTRYSFGAAGLKYTGSSADKKWGWAIGDDKYYRAIVANTSAQGGHESKSIRCVKDIKVETTSTTTP